MLEIFPCRYKHRKRPSKASSNISIGLTTAIAGGKLTGRNLRDNVISANPNNPNYLSPPQNTPRKRKYLERRIDEYGREYIIEREETIE